jgi:hypothetical protein
MTMAVEVIVEDGSGSLSGANSYVSIAEITAWCLTNPHDSIWADLTEAQQNGYAVWSRRVLDEQMAWHGWVINDDQPLDLPRSGLVNRKGRSIDDDEIPAEVQNAQSELARLLAISDRTADSDTVGFKKIKVSSIVLEMDKSDRPPVLPDSVWNMISAFGAKVISKRMSRVVRA